MDLRQIQLGLTSEHSCSYLAEQAERLVDRPGDQDRVLAAGLPAGQRLPRADAQDDESRVLQTAEREPGGAAAEDGQVA